MCTVLYRRNQLTDSDGLTGDLSECDSVLTVQLMDRDGLAGDLDGCKDIGD